jgi:hypothetical protein
LVVLEVGPPSVPLYPNSPNNLIPPFCIVSFGVAGTSERAESALAPPTLPTDEDPRPSRLRDCCPDGQHNRAFYNAFRERRCAVFPRSFFLFPLPACLLPSPLSRVPVPFPLSRVPFPLSRVPRAFLLSPFPASLIPFASRVPSPLSRVPRAFLNEPPTSISNVVLFVGMKNSKKGFALSMPRRWNPVLHRSAAPPREGKRTRGEGKPTLPIANSALWRKDEAGVAHRVDPRATDWCRDCVSEANTSATNFHKKLRARFRLPRAAFTSLIEECKQSQWLAKHESRRARGLQQPRPIELHTLGALRCVGRGWAFGDLEQATKTPLSQRQRFLADFLEIGSAVWRDEWARRPSTAEEANKHCHEFTMAGFPGCLGPADATRVVHLGIPAWLREVHSSHEEGRPARTQDYIVNHRRMASFCAGGCARASAKFGTWALKHQIQTPKCQIQLDRGFV